jgi:hypothetical protein
MRKPVSSICNKARKTFGASPAHAGDGRGCQFDAEQIDHQCSEAVLGQHLIVRQIDDEGCDSVAVLHRCVDTVWKLRARRCTAGLTMAIMRPMFGHDDRLRLGQIKHLSCAMAHAGFRIKTHTAGRTGRRVMIDDFIGNGGSLQGLAFVTLLPARFLARPLAQGRHPRRFLEPIARRWLAAVRTVQSKPTLKFGYPRFESRDLSGLRRDQRNKFFPRWFRPRIRIHPILESKADSAV